MIVFSEVIYGEGLRIQSTKIVVNSLRGLDVADFILVVTEEKM